jgi:tetratricopeptide (TPR) repeat protein
LSEGLAEVFSTVQVTSSGFDFGGDLPARLDTLRRRPLIPVPEFLDGTPGLQFRESREKAAVFYAESWAIAGMLISSPDYGRLDRLFEALRAGNAYAEAFSTVYGKPLASVNKDLRNWIGARAWPRHAIPRSSSPTTVVKQERLSDLDAGMLLADLLLANRDWSRAEAKYRSLLSEYPKEPKLLASLGTLGFDSGNKTSALESWKKAIDSGAADPGLCYRFALLAEDARLPDDEIAHALQKAIAAKPDFDDARYHLAILESNRANYAAAVAQLKAMGTPPGARAYSYWSALASALSELGRTEEATAAAHQAILSAKTPEERGIAVALEYTTKTDFHVQFEQDKDGQMRAVTIRTPHGTEWNPFIEAGDDIDRTSGQLRTVQCNGGKLVGFSVDTAKGALQLEVPNATRVLMRNSPSEFSCGPQESRPVKVEYARPTANRGPLLRGMEFQ